MGEFPGGRSQGPPKLVPRSRSTRGRKRLVARELSVARAESIRRRGQSSAVERLPRMIRLQPHRSRACEGAQCRRRLREGAKMHAVIVGAGMGGLFTALALRESKQFERVDVYEQTLRPSTAGAGLNIAPNGARLCKWLGVDLDGGDPKGPAGALDGGRAAILEATCQVLPNGTRSRRPIDHDTAAHDGAGFHHMHRLDLLMCLHKRVGELGPDAGVECPIRVHMGKRLETLEQDAASVTARFADG